jgi:hypothetical protein
MRFLGPGFTDLALILDFTNYNFRARYLNLLVWVSLKLNENSNIIPLIGL